MRTMTRILIPALPLALLALAGCGGHDPETSAVSAAAPVRAALATAERVEVPQRVELFGTLEAEKTAAVSSRVMAMVTAVRVKAGDAVERGEVLLDIDPQAAQGQLAQARGGLGQARAALALAERNYQRFQALAAANAASELELDMARMQHEQALGAVEQAEGAVAAASSVASDSRVTAPFGGRVVRKMIEVGDLAAPGRPLLMIESRGSRRLRLAVPESVMARAGLAVGDSLAAAVDARPDLGTLQGRVVEMTPGADPASHSFEVKLELPLPPTGGAEAVELPSGTAGRAWVETARREAVAVPAGAILQRGGMTLVVERDADGRAASRAVTLGGELPDGRIEVLSGLAGGETLLLGLGSVPPAGAPVEELTATSAFPPAAGAPAEALSRRPDPEAEAEPSGEKVAAAAPTRETRA